MINKVFACDSCDKAEIRKVEVYRPRYKFSADIIKTNQLTIWCQFKNSYVHKLPTFREIKKCSYKPKSGKIGKKLYQKQLDE